MVALITGSSRGIGKSIAIEFAKRGIDVVINYYKNEKAALELEKYIKETYNVNVLVLQADVSVEEEVEDMINKVIDEFGKIDILVNNAGVERDTNFMDIRVKDFKRILDVNLIGTFLCSKYAAHNMLESKSGIIINISSNNAIDAYYPESSAYDASKSGVISLTHNMAREFAPFIRVNAICPGWVETDMNEGLDMGQIEEEKRKILLNRFAEVEDISKVVVFLASNDAKYINNSIIKVDGGRYNG